MRKTLITLIASLSVLLCTAPVLSAQKDTLRVSTLFTSHIIFSSDITYANRSNDTVLRSMIVEQNRNMIAVRANAPFTEPCSISALESNGRMWTFIVVYDKNPSNLIVDTRTFGGDSDSSASKASSSESLRTKRGTAKSASTWKPGSAPLLSEVHAMKRSLYHIQSKEYGIALSCDNIFSYSDITYIVLSVANGSGISYSVANATFVVESRTRRKRVVTDDETVMPTSRYGNLSAGPGESASIVYSFDKLTLSKNQVLKIYFYEDIGKREQVLVISPADINRARTLMSREDRQ